MKNLCRVLAVAVLFFAVSAFAANFDGSYKFSSRVKDGNPDMVGWTGTMTVAKDTLNRNFKSADGKETKFYDAALKSDGGDLYSLQIARSYKPDQVGQIHKNKITAKGNEVVIEATDGKFKEVWTKN